MRSFKKVGILFLALVIALAGIGGAFAAWTTEVTFQGTVTTGTVEFEDITLYSGTNAWKMDEDQIQVDTGWLDLVNRAVDNQTYPMLIGSAWAAAAPEGVEYDVLFMYDNIFPCVNWCADFKLHYNGSVPVLVNFTLDTSGLLLVTDPDKEDFQIKVSVYWLDDDDEYTENDLIIVDDQEYQWQMHACQSVVVKVCIYVPQNNDLQGGTFYFSGTVFATQWNVCEEDNNNS